MSRRWPGWRATARIARRDAWRNKGRSSLIALMVAIPILAAASLSVLYRSDEADPQDLVALQLGTAQASVSWYAGSGPVTQNLDASSSSSGETADPKITASRFEQKLKGAVPQGDRVTRRVVSYSRSVTLGDRAIPADLVEYDYSGTGGPLEQVSGRAPEAPDEVVVTRSLQRHYGIALGNRLSQKPAAGTTERSYTVVGVVGGLPVLSSRQMIGLPGAVLEPDVSPSDLIDPDNLDSTWFVAGPTPVAWDDVTRINQLGGTVLSRYVLQNPDTAQVDPDLGDYSYIDTMFLATGAVVVGLILLQVALMAGPAIAVGTRRNERGLAVVAATGAEGKHLRSIVLAGSALIGLAASVVAVVLGTAVAAVAIPVMRNHWEVGFARTDVHPLDLLALVAVGTITTLAAALLPARRVARLDVVAAITGRRSLGAPKLRVPLTGAVLVVLGFGVAWVRAGQGHQFTAVLGLAVAEIGLVVSSPAVVGLAARLATRTPFTSRFAFRDAARQRGRTAPAVAAVLAAIAGGMTALVFTAASTEVDRAAYTSTVPLGVVDVPLDPSYRPGYSPNDAALASTSLAASLPVRDLGLLFEPPEANSVSVFKGCSVTDLTGGPDGTVTRSCDGLSGSFAEPAVASIYAAGKPAVQQQIRDALAAGKVVTFGGGWRAPDGTVSVQVSGTGPADEIPPTRSLPAVAVEVGEPVPQPLLPASLAATLGLKLQPSRVIADTTRPVGDPELQRARQALSRAGLPVFVSAERGFDGNENVFALSFLIAAGVVALIGTFTAVGLAAAESRADLGTLAAVGAAPGLRRRLGAAQAGAIVIPGAVLGLISGTAAGWVLIRLNAASNSSWQDPDAWHLAIPWAQTAALGIGIPALAVAVGFVTVRSRLVLVRRLGE